MEEELEQKICHSGESIRDGTQKTACPRPDPGVQLGSEGGVADLRWKVMTRAPPELGGARRSLQMTKTSLSCDRLNFQGVTKKNIVKSTISIQAC